MTKNMSMIDRALRLVAVFVIGAAYLMDYLSGGLAIFLGIVAIAFFATSLIGTCPLYLPFGISTRGKT